MRHSDVLVLAVMVALAATACQRTSTAVEKPVKDRERVVVGEDKPGSVQPPSLPRGLVAGVRIVSAPGLNEVTLTRPVTIRSVERERLVLELDAQQILTILARARGGPLRVKAGDKAQLHYSSSYARLDRRQIVALRIETGDFILSALETGRMDEKRERHPVVVQVPFLQFVARQVGQPKAGTMDVEVQIGSEKRVLTQGQVVEFRASGTSVAIVSSHVSTVSKGNPYALRVVAWASR